MISVLFKNSISTKTSGHCLSFFITNRLRLYNGYTTINSLFASNPVVFQKESKPKSIKYRTIRVREEVALQLDEWRDLFEDASMSEVMWRIFALARRELKRVRDKKRKVRERFMTEGRGAESVVDIGKEAGVE